MITDPVADYLTRIRNAIKAQHRSVTIPSSYMKKRITEILHDQGYIQQYVFKDQQGPQGIIIIHLKYQHKIKIPAIIKLTRVSKPGRRIYQKKEALPHVLNGLGIGIISTSKGVMTDKEARKRGIGGEAICHIY